MTETGDATTTTSTPGLQGAGQLGGQATVDAAAVSVIPTLTTPCSLAAFRNWLKDVDSCRPGDAASLTTTATTLVVS